jgi:hypothetical protein
MQIYHKKAYPVHSGNMLCSPQSRSAFEREPFEPRRAVAIPTSQPQQEGHRMQTIILLSAQNAQLPEPRQHCEPQDGQL